MDFFLDRLTQHAINYAIRSGIGITAGYALRQTGRLLKSVAAPEDREELEMLQDKLQSKIRIISPAIDMIELISARGNTTLESALELTGTIRRDVQSTAQRLDEVMSTEAVRQETSSKQVNSNLQLDIRGVIKDLKRLLSQIEDAVPFLNLAITASGANISSSMPTTVSPSRLLQASTFLTTADSHFALLPSPIQVGPIFTLSLYMLFASHVRAQSEEDIRHSTWKEVIHKARMKLMRVSIAELGNFIDQSHRGASLGPADSARRSEEFAYQLHIIEDLDDHRVHTFEDNEMQPGPCSGVASAGIREVIPIHELSKIFYADTGKILNIGGEEDEHRPILLLKRDKNAIPPRRMFDGLRTLQPTQGNPQQSVLQDPVQAALDAQLLVSGARQPPSEQPTISENTAISSRRIAADLDPEWLAFEVYAERADTDSEDDPEEDSLHHDSSHSPVEPGGEIIASHIEALDLGKSANNTHAKAAKLEAKPKVDCRTPESASDNPFPQIKTSLSLLEVLLRLASLQQFQQTSHLSIEDQFLNFFLNESSSTGVGTGDEHERRRLREEAKRRVGFDPYDESPIKRRGEEYQYRGGTSQAGSVLEPRTPDWQERDRFETEAVPSIDDSGIDTGKNLARLITPRNHCLSASDLPPLSLKASSRSSLRGSSPCVTPEGTIPTPSARGRNSLSHDVVPLGHFASRSSLLSHASTGNMGDD